MPLEISKHALRNASKDHTEVQNQKKKINKDLTNRSGGRPRSSFFAKSEMAKQPNISTIVSSVHNSQIMVHFEKHTQPTSNCPKKRRISNELVYQSPVQRESRKILLERWSWRSSTLWQQYNFVEIVDDRSIWKCIHLWRTRIASGTKLRTSVTQEMHQRSASYFQLCNQN